MSVRASGETDAFSDPSVETAEAGVSFDGRCSPLSPADSANSLKICAFMIGVDAVFFLCGLTIGDWRTLPFLALETFPFLTFFDRSIEVVGGPFDSRSISWGEFVVFVLPPNPRCVSFCACKAGEVKGLK